MILPITSWNSSHSSFVNSRVTPRSVMLNVILSFSASTQTSNFSSLYTNETAGVSIPAPLPPERQTLFLRMGHRDVAARESRPAITGEKIPLPPPLGDGGSGD